MTTPTSAQLEAANLAHFHLYNRILTDFTILDAHNAGTPITTLALAHSRTPDDLYTKATLLAKLCSQIAAEAPIKVTREEQVSIITYMGYDQPQKGGMGVKEAYVKGKEEAKAWRERWEKHMFETEGRWPEEFKWHFDAQGRPW